MADLSLPSSPQELEDLVRDALLHLYDQGYLLRHPLARLVDVTEGSGGAVRAKRLVQILLDAIEAFRPTPGTPADSRAWRHYHLLEDRYIGGASASEVIARLDISKSQYQRDHAGALGAVATLLWDRWQFDSRQSQKTEALISREALAISETNDLVIQMHQDYVDLGELLSELLALLHSMATENQIALAFEPPPSSVLIRGDRVVLRMIFLGLLNLILGRSFRGTVAVSIERSESSVCVNLEATPGNAELSATELLMLDDPEIEVSHRLVHAMGGEMTLHAPRRGAAWHAQVTLQNAKRPVLLVVDNHADFPELVKRYLAETDWQVAGAPDVIRGQQIAAEIRPSAILLDVMMPEQDGWDLLLALKSRPETRRIPVIICSVLYEPQIARTLGATRYLAKPIKQSDLLEALASVDPGKPGPVQAGPPR